MDRQTGTSGRFFFGPALFDCLVENVFKSASEEARNEIAEPLPVFFPVLFPDLGFGSVSVAGRVRAREAWRANLHQLFSPRWSEDLRGQCAPLRAYTRKNRL
jgi:hypothetical protein